MATCERCNIQFTPELPVFNQLCPSCANAEKESVELLKGVQECVKPESPVQNLLTAPGVALALIKLTIVLNNDLTLLSLNSFRLGAWMALNREKLRHLVED